MSPAGRRWWRRGTDRDATAPTAPGTPGAVPPAAGGSGSGAPGAPATGTGTGPGTGPGGPARPGAAPAGPAEPTVRAATEQAIAEAAALLGPRHRAPAALLPALDALDGYRELTARPMRVALVGRVSAGKSTLVNALLGAERVGTGAEELTFNVSRLTHGPHPGVTVHYKDGRPPSSHRPEELGELTARARDDAELHARLCAIDHLVLTDPSPYLHSFDLVDTPGLDSVFGADSANTLRFLGRSGDEVRQDSLGHAAGADALVLVFARGLAQGEEELLADFTGAGFGAGGALTTVGVLTKTELYWPEHPDPLAAGRRVADRVMSAAGGTRLMYDLRPLCSLVGAAAGQLTEQDFADLVALAAVEPALLARRAARGPYFTTRPYPDLPVPAEHRARLFGLLAGYGITLACGLVRDGVGTLPELRRELDERSGLADFRRLLADHFGARADLIKLRRIVDRARTLPQSLAATGAGASPAGGRTPGSSASPVGGDAPTAGEAPATEVPAPTAPTAPIAPTTGTAPTPGDPADARTRAALDRAVGCFVDLEVQQHAFRELTVLRDCYDGRLTGLSDADLREIRHVGGEFGSSPAARLDLPEGTDPAELRRAALDRLSRWSAMTGDPTFSGPTRRACQVLRRSYERLAAQL